MINQSKFIRAKSSRFSYYTAHLLTYSSYILITITFCNIIRKTRPNTCSCYKSLAFTANILDANKKIAERYYTIIFKGIDNSFLQNELTHFLKIDNIALRNKKLTRTQLTNILYRLKISGFFHSIKAFSDVSDTQRITVYLDINPLLREIRIIKLHKLKISKRYIRSLFNQQLGLPKNFILISENLQKIKEWYYIRGFEWTKVKLINDKDNISQLTIQIIEAKIEEAKLICLDSIDSKRILFLDKIIREQLQINIGDTVNINKIEAGLKNLKEKKIIFEGHYKISFINNKLNITLKYKYQNQPKTFLLSKNISELSQWKQLWYHILKGSIRTAAQKYKTYHRYIDQKDQQASMLTYPLYNNLDYKLSTYLVHSSEQLNIAIYKFLKSPIVLGNKYTLQLKHFFSNNKKNNRILDVQLNSCNPIFILQHAYPFIKFGNDREAYINLSTFKQLYVQQNHNFILQEINTKKTNLSDEILRLYGINFICKHNLLQNMLALETLEILRSAAHYKSLQKTNLLLGLKQLNFCNRDPQLYTSYKTAAQNLLLGRIVVKYDAISAQQKSKTGQYLKIDSHHFLPIYLKKYQNSLRMRKNFYHNLNIQYKQSLRLPKIKRLESIQSLFMSINTNISIGDLVYIPISKDLIAINSQYIQNSDIINIVPTSYSYLLNLEYHLNVLYNVSVYLFTEYMHSDYAILASTERQHFNNQLSNLQREISFGLGIQFNIPFYRIPPMRLEYKIDSHSNQSYHVKFLSL